MRRYTVPEKTFLKNFVLNQFNFQYGEKIKQENCDIQSIEPENNYKLGYEIIYNCEPKKFKVRVFVNIARSDELCPFILKVKKNFGFNNLEDEYFVAYGSIDTGHSIYNNYSFSPLRYEPCDNFAYLLSVDNKQISLANGGGILLT